jgi:3-hydroxyisobutyrate dehydrogenase
VAFLGLGVMGHPMAGHLARAGHQVTVYNRTAAKAQAWVAEYGGARRPRRARRPPVPTSCSPASATTTTCARWCWAPTAPSPAWPGAVFVDHTTASAAVARELHAVARALGLHFVDAPVSGGQAGAVNGLLTVMCGGDAEPSPP